MLHHLANHIEFKKVINSANDPDKHLTVVNNQYLSYNQLIKRTQNLSAKLYEEKMKSLNKNRKIIYLNKTMALHQRFMVLIQDNSVPKLHEIVKVAFFL